MVVKLALKHDAAAAKGKHLASCDKRYYTLPTITLSVCVDTLWFNKCAVGRYETE